MKTIQSRVEASWLGDAALLSLDIKLEAQQSDGALRKLMGRRHVPVLPTQQLNTQQSTTQRFGHDPKSLRSHQDFLSSLCSKQNLSATSTSKQTRYPSKKTHLHGKNHSIVIWLV